MLNRTPEDRLNMAQHSIPKWWCGGIALMVVPSRVFFFFAVFVQRGVTKQEFGGCFEKDNYTLAPHGCVLKSHPTNHRRLRSLLWRNLLNGTHGVDPAWSRFAGRKWEKTGCVPQPGTRETAGLARQMLSAVKYIHEASIEFDRKPSKERTRRTSS